MQHDLQHDDTLVDSPVGRVQTGPRGASAACNGRLARRPGHTRFRRQTYELFLCYNGTPRPPFSRCADVVVVVRRGACVGVGCSAGAGPGSSRWGLVLGQASFGHPAGHGGGAAACARARGRAPRARGGRRGGVGGKTKYDFEAINRNAQTAVDLDEKRRKTHMHRADPATHVHAAALQAAAATGGGGGGTSTGAAARRRFGLDDADRGPRVAVSFSGHAAALDASGAVVLDASGAVVVSAARETHFSIINMRARDEWRAFEADVDPVVRRRYKAPEYEDRAGEACSLAAWAASRRPNGAARCASAAATEALRALVDARAAECAAAAAAAPPASAAAVAAKAAEDVAEAARAARDGVNV